MDESELVERCLRRPVEQEAWAELWRRLYPVVSWRVQSRVRLVTSLDLDVSDIVQLVFVKIFQNLHKFDERRGSLMSFVDSIVRSTVIDGYRTSRRRLRSEVEETAALGAHGGNEVQAFDSDTALAEALLELDANAQAGMSLFLKGMSIDAIAHATGTTPRTVYRWIEQYRDSVRSNLRNR